MLHTPNTPLKENSFCLICLCVYTFPSLYVQHRSGTAQADVFIYAKCSGSPWLLQIPAGDDEGRTWRSLAGRLFWTRELLVLILQVAGFTPSHFQLFMIQMFAYAHTHTHTRRLICWCKGGGWRQTLSVSVSLLCLVAAPAEGNTESFLWVIFAPRSMKNSASLSL